ncbi:MAG: hypothetical protein CSA33_02565 [Desulfobulbus propionicus]|nr:MAG: hypothetical protein CSA33_02565 [Desulfobulbus propionicus]
MQGIDTALSSSGVLLKSISTQRTGEETRSRKVQESLFVSVHILGYDSCIFSVADIVLTCKVVRRDQKSMQDCSRMKGLRAGHGLQAALVRV